MEFTYFAYIAKMETFQTVKFHIFVFFSSKTAI